MKTAILLSSALLLLAPTAVSAQETPACRAPIGHRPPHEGVRLDDVAAEAGDLPAIRATHVASGAHMLIYYDAVSERAARARSACLGAQLGLLEQALDDDRRDAEWDSVVFTIDPDHAPPRGEGRPARWTIHLPTDGALNDAAERFISSTMPHEQTHDFQGRNRARAPRWFVEGHASWVALKVAEQIRPDIAALEIADHNEAAAASTTPLALAAWGGVQPKPEAILRQLSPEDRARMGSDPSFNPPGPFRFTS